MGIEAETTFSSTWSEHFRVKYGPWAVVTGASDGIGREFASSLATAGINLILVARRQAVLEELASRLRSQHGIEVRVVAVDLAIPGSIALIEQASGDVQVGLLVAAAGFGTSGAFISGPLLVELELVEVNCSAVLAVTHNFARRFAAQGHGGLVLMSSLLAFQGVPRSANYAASKAYIQTLAEGLRLELAPHGVDVIASAPGPIRSGFEARARMRMSMGLPPAVVARETLQALGHRGTVRPGWLSKFLEGSLAPLPRWGRTRIMAQVMRGMTKHQDERNPVPAEKHT